VTDAARLLALAGGAAAVGVAALLLAGLPRTRAWIPTIAGLAPVTGIAACGLAASVGAMVGIDVHPVSTALLVGALLVGVWLAARPLRPRIGALACPGQGALGRVCELVFLGALAALSVGIVRLAAATDLYAWDGWAMWAPKAHALFVDGDVWGPVFREPAYTMQHQEYPILVPALEALSAGSLGRFDPVLVDTAAAAVVVAFGWAVWALLRMVVAPAAAAATALALTGSAPLVENATATYADAVVAAFAALGVLCLLLWLVEDSLATLVLAALFLSAAASSKAEGLVFAVAAIVAAVATARGFGRTVRAAAAFGIAALAVPAAWAVVDRLNGAGAKNIDRAAFFDPGTMLDEAGRIPTAAWGLLSEVADGWPAASTAVLLAVAAACLGRLWWHAAFLVLWAAFAFLSLVGVYYASTAPVDWLLVTSGQRVVFSIVLASAATAPVLAWLAWERVRPGEGPADAERTWPALREASAPAGDPAPGRVGSGE
jgi:hypothetical protein